MSDAASEFLDSAGELVHENSTEDGVDIPAIHRQILDSFGDEIDIETLEALKVATMNQAAMFCAVVDQMIAEKTVT